jgi:hypothetical protein
VRARSSKEREVAKSAEGEERGFDVEGRRESERVWQREGEKER